MNPKILVIEDSRTQSRMLVELLEANGCETIAAMTGEEARQQYGKTKFDLILLDMVLPDASGLLLLNEIKASTHCSNSSVIILSGVTDKGNIVDALNLGASDYITKPFHQAELLLRVNLHISVKKASEGLSQTLAAKNKLISVIAHDLKSPFNGLLGFAKMLVNGHRTLSVEERDQYINQVYDSALGIFELLNNLVMWATVQQNEMKPELKLVQPHVLVEEAIAVLKLSTDSQALALAIMLDRKMTIEADPNMFSFIVRNLITNCMRFMQPSQKLTLSSTSKESQGREGLEFILEFPGGGFPPAFLQATKTNEKDNSPHGRKGLGLGLSLTLDFIEAHEATINFENIDGRGGQVTFFIPRAPSIKTN
jgi:two-component system, sensor histidine kinase and response regulator